MRPKHFPTRDHAVPRFYRGRLIGFVQRSDNAAALRAMAELNRCEDEERKLSKLTR